MSSLEHDYFLKLAISPGLAMTLRGLGESRDGKIKRLGAGPGIRWVHRQG